jgi:large subunit ribosomal protein L25
MQIVDLPVVKREKFGSAASRRYRRAAAIPCILYGNRQANVPLAVQSDDFAKVLKTHSRLVKLRLGSDEQTALVREVAWDPYGERVEHIDFVRVEMTDEIAVEVPIEFVGIPVGVTKGGVLEPILSDLEVRCRVSAIPESIVVDVSGLELFQGIHVDELKLPEGVRTARSGRDLIVHVVEPKKLEVAAPAAPAEGEAAPAEGAAAPAAAEGEAAPAAPKGEKDKEPGGKEPAKGKGGKEK